MTEQTDLAGIVATALTEGMATYATEHQLPRLEWRLEAGTVVGHAGADYDEEAVPAVLHAWAEHLSLSAEPAPVAGTAAYAGPGYGLTIEVWGVVDRETFDRNQ